MALRCLSRLLEPELYQPGLWDLRSDSRLVSHWTRVFELQLRDMLELLRQRSPTELTAARAARDQFMGLLAKPVTDWLESHPTVHSWTLERERVLVAHGVVDPYRELKQRENRRALQLLPSLLAANRKAASLEQRLALLLSLLFAGNLFDLGSPAVGRSLPRGDDLLAQAARLARRSPLIDDRPRLCERLELVCREHQSLVILVDNAGPDFVCGCLPLALELATRGAEVTLAANHTPSLNDITCNEAAAVLREAAALSGQLERMLAQQRLRLVDTGNTTPGIDLRCVSGELECACERAVLLLLVGQGRAVETNWKARLDRDCARIATLKDRLVAAELGGAPGDTLAELRPAAAPAPAPRDAAV